MVRAERSRLFAPLLVGGVAIVATAGDPFAVALVLPHTPTALLLATSQVMGVALGVFVALTIGCGRFSAGAGFPPTTAAILVGFSLTRTILRTGVGMDAGVGLTATGAATGVGVVTGGGA